MKLIYNFKDKFRNKKSTIPVYYGRERYYTKTNSEKWIGPDKLERMCKNGKLYRQPFGTNFASSYVYAVCIDSKNVLYFIMSKDTGKSWENIEWPNKLVPERFTAPSGGKNNGFIVSWTSRALYYMKFNENKFTKMKMPVFRSA